MEIGHSGKTERWILENLLNSWYKIANLEEFCGEKTFKTRNYTKNYFFSAKTIDIRSPKLFCDSLLAKST